MANGGVRPSTIRDAKKHGWWASVSTVQALTGDADLFNWQKEQVIDACWLDPYVGQDLKTWKSGIRLMADMKRKTAADNGSRIHKALECMFTGNFDQDGFNANDISICMAVRSWLEGIFGDINWHAEKTFTCGNGLNYGGCVDLHNRDGNGIVIDFKTQDTGDGNNFKYYKKYCMQLAAYRVGLGLPNADCYILKVSSSTPGVIGLKKYSESELQDSFTAFELLLKYYNVVNLGRK